MTLGKTLKNVQLKFLSPLVMRFYKINIPEYHVGLKILFISVRRFVAAAASRTASLLRVCDQAIIYDRLLERNLLCAHITEQRATRVFERNHRIFKFTHNAVGYNRFLNGAHASYVFYKPRFGRKKRTARGILIRDDVKIKGIETSTRSRLLTPVSKNADEHFFPRSERVLRYVNFNHQILCFLMIA